MMPNRIQSENINCQAFGLSDRENQGFVCTSHTNNTAQKTRSMFFQSNKTVLNINTKPTCLVRKDRKPVDKKRPQYIT